MNIEKLRTLIYFYNIKVYGGLGQLIYLNKFSLRSILLCSNYVIKNDFIKGFIDDYIFNKLYDNELIDDGKIPPQLEFFLDIDEKHNTILIKPKY